MNFFHFPKFEMNFLKASTHFGRAGLEIFWELGNYVPEFAVSLLLMAITLRTLKPKLRV